MADTEKQVKKTQRRRITGIVVSDKMQNAVVVRVDRTKTHERYHKKYTVSKRFHVHDPKNEAHFGDTVEIEETRPISKTICWRVISVTPAKSSAADAAQEKEAA